MIANPLVTQRVKDKVLSEQPLQTFLSLKKQQPKIVNNGQRAYILLLVDFITA